MGKLTVRQVETFPAGKYADGNGLWLWVSRSGARKWVARITVNGKRREMGLGAYGKRAPGVTLAQAREKAAQARSQAAEGIDPVEARRKVETGTPTFTSLAVRYIRKHRHGWRNAKHQRQWVSTLKTYARPVIGTKPIDQITTEDVLTILEPIWITRTETAKRLQGRIENILDYASAMKYRDQTNPARWRGHLQHLLSSPTKVKTVRHHPAMPYTEVPALMIELQAIHGTAALALQWVILTATRTSETLNATWSEIDLDAVIWTVPADRTKTRTEHRVPLCRQALAILKRTPRIVGNPYVFPGMRTGRPLSQMALLKVMRGMGYGTAIPEGVTHRGDYVPHGFRSSFRDWSGEVSSFPRDVCEQALGHALPNKVEAAYRRGDLLAKRAKMMQAWADWCSQGTAESRVVPLRAAQ